MDVAEIETHSKDIKSIGSSLEKAEKEKDRTEEEYNLSLIHI